MHSKHKPNQVLRGELVDAVVVILVYLKPVNVVCLHNAPVNLIVVVVVAVVVMCAVCACDREQRKTVCVYMRKCALVCMCVNASVCCVPVCTRVCDTNLERKQRRFDVLEQAVKVVVLPSLPHVALDFPRVGRVAERPAVPALCLNGRPEHRVDGVVLRL